MANMSVGDNVKRCFFLSFCAMYMYFFLRSSNDTLLTPEAKESDFIEIG